MTSSGKMFIPGFIRMSQLVKILLGTPYTQVLVFYKLFLMKHEKWPENLPRVNAALAESGILATKSGLNVVVHAVDYNSALLTVMLLKLMDQDVLLGIVPVEASGDCCNIVIRLFVQLHGCFGYEVLSRWASETVHPL
jgi:hypothetical protein